jgi:small subunit ribosomal protein S20
MANTLQARKRARQNIKRRQRNTSARSMFRTYIKKVISAIESGEKQAAQEAYNAAIPIIDKMVTKNIIHKNKAARHKSRLHKRIKEMKE